MTNQPTPRRQHVDIASEAGFGRLSFISILAGVVTAYGAFAIVASIVGAILSSVDVDTEFRSNNWTGSGAVAALATAVTLLLAYFFGGYVAGRMGRRSPVLNGLGVFVLSLLIAAAASIAVTTLADDEQLRSNLRSVGIPTTMDQITGVAATAVIVSVAAMLVGAVLGAVLGERWHTKLARRVADPDIGPAAEHRREADALDATRQDRLGRDSVIERETAPPDHRQVESTGNQVDGTGNGAAGSPSSAPDVPDSTGRPVAATGPDHGERST